MSDEDWNTEHLKDCPFCGSRPVREITNDVLFIRCPECFVAFANHVRFGCRADAQWNRRQDDEPCYPDDMHDDAEALASAGWGTDEDYGGGCEHL